MNTYFILKRGVTHIVLTLLVSACILEAPYAHASVNEEPEWVTPNMIQAEAVDGLPEFNELSEEEFDHSILTPLRDESQLNQQGTNEFLVIGNIFHRGHKHEQFLALACIDFDQQNFCRQARFIYGNKQHVEMIGSPLQLQYKVKHGRTVLDRKKMKQSVAALFPSLAVRREKAKGNRVEAIVTAGIGWAICSGTGLLPVELLGAGYALLMFFANSIGNPDARIIGNGGASYSSVTHVFTDQSGWNWGEKSQRLNAKVFDGFIQDLGK